VSKSSVRRRYEFIKANQHDGIKPMCRLPGVTRGGYYAWLKAPISNRAQEDAKLLRLIRASFVASHGIYGAHRLLDLREAGEACSKHRVARLMRTNGIRAVRGYGVRQHRAA
jgi:putative transposase